MDAAFITEEGSKAEKNINTAINLVDELEGLAKAESNDDNEYGQALLEASADLVKKYLSETQGVLIIDAEPAELNEDLGAQND